MNIFLFNLRIAKSRPINKPKNKDKDKVGFDDKNATIDFYNVGFIQDKFGKSEQKSVAIICEKNKLPKPYANEIESNKKVYICNYICYI